MGKRQLNILQIISGKTWSGGQQQTLHLLAGLRKREHNSILACPPGSQLGDKAEELDIKVYRVPMRKEADLSSARQLYRIMKEERVDVVNAQRPSAHTLGLIAARLARIPVFVATRRVSVPVNFLSAKLKYSLADRIISVSDAVREILIGCGVQPRKVVTVYSGIDLSRFNPDKLEGSRIRKEFGISPDAPLVGMIGNVGRFKGQREFLKAAKLVLRDIPNARFMLVGSGAEKGFIESIDREMLPYFICAGFRRDIPEILAALDLHVNSSIGFDGLAGTIREGLAMRRPTVATDVAGHKEIIRDMETGLLAPPSDDKALASAIVKLVKDKELAARLATKGREFVEQNMAEEIMVKRTEAVYLDVLRGKGLS